MVLSEATGISIGVGISGEIWISGEPATGCGILSRSDHHSPRATKIHIITKSSTDQRWMRFVITVFYLLITANAFTAFQIHLTVVSRFIASVIACSYLPDHTSCGMRITLTLTRDQDQR